MGNIFTHYNYTTTDIIQIQNNHITEINSIQSKFKITFETPTEEVLLPQNSPFKDWKEARRFAGPLPFTFTYNQDKKEVLIIEGVRQNWIPNPIKVIDYNIPLLHDLNLNQITLANAFVIKNIPYFWKKGKIEIWHQ